MIIVDASVAIKWIYKETDSETAVFLLQRHLKQEQNITVPHFLFIEVANVLATKSRYSQQDITEGMKFLSQSHLEIYEIVHEDIIYAAQLAKEYKTSVYDMLYAVIAKRSNCTLITADEKFAQKVKFPFVKVLASDY